MSSITTGTSNTHLQPAPALEATSVFKTATPSPLQTYGPLLLRLIVIVAAIAFALFPVIWIISASFNTNGSMASQRLIPVEVNSAADLVKPATLNDLLVNYCWLFNGSISYPGRECHWSDIPDNIRNSNTQVPFWRWMWNSIRISGITTVLVLFITSISAYAFSRFRFRGRRGLLLTIFLVQVFPNLLAMVAFYLMLVQIGRHISWLALDTQGGIILIYMGGGIAINTWLMKGYFDTIPRDIDESALVDGATHWQSFRYLIFPLVRPVIAVVGMLAFVGTFNDFLLSRILLKERENWTLIRGMFSFVETGQFSTQWGVFAAGSLIAAIPIVILYITLQRFIVGGLTVGAVKG